MTPEKKRLLDEIVAALSAVPDLKAVALGGSHARGTQLAQSDLDIGLYYRADQPFVIARIREIARRFSAASEPTVTDFYGWGPFVNGGAWIINPVSKIDFLYRNLDQLDEIVREALAGQWRHSFDQHPPFGFRTVTTLGEIHYAKPLYDPENILGPLKARIAVFPPALKAEIVPYTLQCAEFAFVHACDFYAKAADVLNTVACMTRIVHYLVQALFALNETYFMNDKRVWAEIEKFALKPHDFEKRLSAVLGAAGTNEDGLADSVTRLRAVFDDVVRLADGAYMLRF